MSENHFDQPSKAGRNTQQSFSKVDCAIDIAFTLLHAHMVMSQVSTGLNFMRRGKEGEE